MLQTAGAAQTEIEFGSLLSPVLFFCALFLSLALIVIQRTLCVCRRSAVQHTKTPRLVLVSLWTQNAQFESCRKRMRKNRIWNQRLKEKKQNYCHSITFFIVSYLYFLRIRSPCTCTSDWSSSTSFDLAPSGFFFCSVKTGRTFKGTRFQSLDQTKKQVVTWFQRHLLKKKEFADGNITAEELRIKKRCLKAVTCDCDQVAVVFISDPQSMFLVN